MNEREKLLEECEYVYKDGAKVVFDFPERSFILRALQYLLSQKSGSSIKEPECDHQPYRPAEYKGWIEKCKKCGGVLPPFRKLNK